MRRIALSTLALALTLGTASIAAAQQPQREPDQQQWGQRGRWQRAAQGGRRALFRGVKLTDQQKQQIKAINQKYAAQSRSIRQSLRPVAQQARTERQKGDTAAARAAFERTRPQRDQLRNLREQQLREVRAVLTPDQQKTFDQNLARLKARMEQRRPNRRG